MLRRFPFLYWRVMKQRELMDHLMGVHGYNEMTWPDKQQRLAAGPEVWEVYHTHLHKTNCGHRHAGEPEVSSEEWWEPMASVWLVQEENDATVLGVYVTEDMARSAAKGGERVTEAALNPPRHSGASIYDRVWSEMDSIMDRLMGGNPQLNDKYQAQGLAFALAVFDNPGKPDINAVRKRAVERWKERGE